MKSVISKSRRFFLAGGLVAMLGLPLVGMTTRPALAHEAKCPVCKLDVVQNTDKQDNEVALKFGRKRIEYRCVYCALADAKNFQGDVTILAPSEVKDKPVLLTRKDGKWSATPENAVFVGQKVNHRSCQLGYRALTNSAAFEKWVHENHALLGDAKPLTLEQLVEVTK